MGYLFEAERTMKTLKDAYEQWKRSMNGLNGLRKVKAEMKTLKQVMDDNFLLSTEQIDVKKVVKEWLEQKRQDNCKPCSLIEICAKSTIDRCPEFDVYTELLEELKGES